MKTGAVKFQVENGQVTYWQQITKKQYIKSFSDRRARINEAVKQALNVLQPAF